MSEKTKDRLRSLHHIVFVSRAADLGSSSRLGPHNLLSDSSMFALTFMEISMNCQSQKKMKGIAFNLNVIPRKLFLDKVPSPPADNGTTPVTEMFSLRVGTV